MEKVFVTPAADMRVRKQDGSILAESGEAVERNAFWLRRQRDGDVTLDALPDGALAASAPASDDSTAANAATKTKK